MSVDRWYWASFDKLREELGYADCLDALQRYRAAIDHRSDGNHRLLLMSGFRVDYPFADQLYQRALPAGKAVSEVSGRRSRRSRSWQGRLRFPAEPSRNGDDA